jgi:hypothetical protein
MKQLANFEHFNIIKEAEEKLEQYLDSLYESLYFEDINEAKSLLFSFNYDSTDEDSVDYIQGLLKDARVDAIAQPGFEPDEMAIKAKNEVELRKAKKVIQANGFKIYESLVNEAEAQPKTKIGAALGSPVKFIKIKNNAKKYQQVLVQKALNDVDFEKKKQAADDVVDKDKNEVLKAANKAKNQALSDKATAISDRMKDLATSPGLQKVKTLAISKAKVAAAETALKGADAEESKQLKVKIKELNAKAAEAEKAIKDYEKEGADQQQEAPQEAPQQQEGPKVKDDKKEDPNKEKIDQLNTKIEAAREKYNQASEGDDVKAKTDTELAVAKLELEKAKLENDKDAIQSAQDSIERIKMRSGEAAASDDTDQETADNTPEEKTDDPTASLEKDIADFDKNIETEMATINKLKKDLDQAKLDAKTGRGSDAEILKIQKSLDDSNEDLAELKKRKAEAKAKIQKMQKESVTYLSESVADKFRYLMSERLK